MNIRSGASVELNGTDATLGSLSGAGVIGNKRATLSTLSVGGFDSSSLFVGSITGNLAITKIGSGELMLAGLNTYTGTTTIEAGTLKLIAAGASVPGLVYRLDASQPNTFTTLADGTNVTSWMDAEGSGYAFSSASDANCPTYDSSLFNGRGGMRFGVGTARSRMIGSSTTNAQTVMAVHMLRNTSNDNGGFWGLAGSDSGLRITADNWQYPGNNNDFHSAAAGGLVYINGVVSNSTTFVGQPSLLTSVSGSRKTFTPAIGDYWFSNEYPRRAFRGEVAEILVYDRKLTDAERETIETSLMAKWFSAAGDGSIIPESTKVSVGAEATFDLAGGSVTIGSLEGGGNILNGVLRVTGGVAPDGTLSFTETPELTGTLALDIASNGDCDQLAVAGALDVSGLDLVLNLPENQPSVHSYTLVSASGGITGPFKSASIPAPWKLLYEANTIRLVYFSGTLIIVR